MKTARCGRAHTVTIRVRKTRSIACLPPCCILRSAAAPAATRPSPRACSATARSPRNKACRRLQQHDVVLLLTVAGLDLQGDALAHEITQHRQVLAFLLEEQVHHGLRGQYPELLWIELAR